MSNAQEHLEKAIQINPEFADAHYELALMLKDKKEYKNFLTKYDDYRKNRIIVRFVF